VLWRGVGVDICYVRAVCAGNAAGSDVLRESDCRCVCQQPKPLWIKEEEEVCLVLLLRHASIHCRPARAR